MSDRSARAEVRNPLLALPAARRIARLPEDQREALAGLLRDLAADAADRAEEFLAAKEGADGCLLEGCFGLCQAHGASDHAPPSTRGGAEQAHAAVPGAGLMPRFYMDVTAEKPAPGARIPVAGEAAASFVAARADMERMACAQVEALLIEGQVGIYADPGYNDFRGYAIRYEGKPAFFEAAEEEAEPVQPKPEGPIQEGYGVKVRKSEVRCDDGLSLIDEYQVLAKDPGTGRYRILRRYSFELEARAEAIRLRAIRKANGVKP